MWYVMWCELVSVLFVDVVVSVNLEHLAAVFEDNVESVLCLSLVGVGDHSER